ncbi:MAG: AAC(3) family N-acetyltransferase [Planctomycetota bacterium]|nr:AAC(3) family N-acetyltransferase [Planctomycetota bacterium]
MARDLRALGIREGDVVLMHSRATSVARAHDLNKAPDLGMRWVIEALLDAVGPDGLLAVPTFTRTFAKTSEGPTGEVWHPDRTPSRVGSLTNYLLKWPGRFRSDHPTHSVAAVGKRAAEFCAGHSWREGATTFDWRGPWGKLVEWDGKILWLGTDMRTQTAVHTVEDWMRLPYMATCTALVDDGGRTVEIGVTQSPAGPRDFYRKGSKVETAWDAAGIARAGKVGLAECRLMDAAAFMGWLWKALLESPALLLPDGPDNAWSVEAKANTEDHVRKLKAGIITPAPPEKIMRKLGVV